MTRCKFKQGEFNCGSYAFNLYKEDIDQGDYCDRHYWQDQAIKARADEREQALAAPVPMGHIVGEIDHTGKVWAPITEKGQP